MRHYQRGQILLIVVVVMVTALTVGLSVVARSITDKKTSQESANSEKAFSAAEAGIERSLTTTGNKTYKQTFTNNNTSYNAIVTTISGNQFPLNNAAPVLKDDSTTLWLSTYPNYTRPRSGPITFYWGRAGDTCLKSEATNSMTALELVVISGSAANPKMARYAYDPCVQRRLGNNLLPVPGGGGAIAGVNYRFSVTITVTNGLFVEATPLYASSAIAVKGCNAGGANCVAFPTQGTVIQAVGTADTTQRKLLTYQYYPQLPAEMFQYSIFAPQ